MTPEDYLDCWNSGPEGWFKGSDYGAHLAYMLATAYRGTTTTMCTVRAGLDVSDQWRKTHLSH